jgi:hypothetical protein
VKLDPDMHVVAIGPDGRVIGLPPLLPVPETVEDASRAASLFHLAHLALSFITSDGKRWLRFTEYLHEHANIDGEERGTDWMNDHNLRPSVTKRYMPLLDELAEAADCLEGVLAFADELRAKREAARKS